MGMTVAKYRPSLKFPNRRRESGAEFFSAQLDAKPRFPGGLDRQRKSRAGTAPPLITGKERDMSLFDWLFENKSGDGHIDSSGTASATATRERMKSIDDLMRDYGAARNWTEQYNILQKAAELANEKIEKLQVIAKIYQFKRDHGL
jgi:hypothetical protein